jgi:uncharacterized protein YjiS (DUF1127 family)
MFAVDHDKVGYSSSPVLQQVGRGVMAPLMFIGGRLRLDRIVYWIQDEIQRAALIRELNRLDDHYLRDIGIYRADIDDMADAMVRRRREGRKHS